MKHSLLAFALMGIYCICSATTYYSQGSLSPNSLSNWNSNRLGGGTTPSSFTSGGDEFVIQFNHVMYTTGTWIVGSSSSSLKIEGGGVLHAVHPVLLTGFFQILDGGVYYHDNNASTSSSAGTSIFGGTELFSPLSRVEIRNWINNATPLPASVNWGILVINYASNIGGNWNQQGNLTNIQRDLIIKRTGLAGQDFRLTTNTSFTLTVGRNLEIEQTTLLVKDGNAAGTTAIVQVNGDVNIVNGTLNLGTVDFKPNNELRFRGNMLVAGSGSVTATTEEPMLVANSGSVQSLFTDSPINTGFKVLGGTTIKLNSALTMGNLRPLIIAGMFNAAGNAITMNGGTLAVPGGWFMSSSKIDMKDGVCQVCQGNGSFSFSTGWCSNSGDTGVINFSYDTIQFNRSVASALKIGDLNSKGKLFLTNNAVIAFTGPTTGPFPNRGAIELSGNGTLSFDENSLAIGDAFYSANGGWLVTGSPAGLVVSGGGGSIRINGARNYNNAGLNSYEFKSSLAQFTGPGLPTSIAGTLKFNNSSILGVTLTQSTTVQTGATLYLERGIIKTNSSTALLTLNNNSNFIGGSSTGYIDGPFRKFGNQNFTFHVGKSGRYSPVVINADGGGNAADVYTVEYYPDNPAAIYGNQLFQLIEHISTAEYWNITGTNNRQRQLRFKITPYSGVTDFPTLVIAYFEGFGWINLGEGTKTGNTSNGTMEVTAFNYGPFTFGSTSANTNSFLSALPVRVISFTARRNGEKGILNWEVSADTDADYFEILSSNDNRNFFTLARVPANSNQRLYQYVDPQLKPGTTFYRLRVVEKNGTPVLSKIAALFYSVKGLQLVSVNPSVVRDRTMITLATSDRTTVQLMITDAQGKIVRSTRADLLQGTNNIPLDLSNLGSGIYYVFAVNAEGRTNVLRLLKQ